MSDDELTPSEKKAMKGLPRERMPSVLLQKRIVNALRERGFLHSSKRRYFEVTAQRVAWVCAVSVALVVAGFALGQWTGSRSGGAERATSNFETSELAIAASVQRAGTAYVSALETLAMLPDSTSSDEMFQGREVALNTLYAAAHEMIRIVPNDVLADRILSALEDLEIADSTEEINDTGRRVIWF